jgi:hypothetical protein
MYSFSFAKNTPFSLLSFTECSSFSATAFGFRFCLDLRSALVISFHQGVFLPDLYWFSSKEVFIKISNGLGKEKKLYAK